MPVSNEKLAQIVIAPLAGLLKPLWDMSRTAANGEKRVALARTLGEACRQERCDPGVVREAFEGLFGRQSQISVPEIIFLVNHLDDYVLRLRDFLRFRKYLAFQLDPPIAVWTSPTARRRAITAKWIHRTLAFLFFLVMLGETALIVADPDSGSRLAGLLIIAASSIGIGTCLGKASLLAKADDARISFKTYLRTTHRNGKNHPPARGSIDLTVAREVTPELRAPAAPAPG